MADTLTPHLFVVAHEEAGHTVEFARWCNSPAVVVRDAAGVVVDVMRLDRPNSQQDIKLQRGEVGRGLPTVGV